MEEQSFSKFCKHLIKMEAQKIVNLLDTSSEDKFSKFSMKKWYVIHMKIQLNF